MVIDRIIMRKDRGAKSDGAGQLMGQGRVGSLDGEEERINTPLRRDLEGVWGVETRDHEGLESGNSSIEKVRQE